MQPGEAIADAGPQDVIVTDTNLFNVYQDLVPFPDRIVVVAAGESSKTLAVYETVTNQLSALGVTRSCRLFALGGGVIGDLAGFAAATYMRGIPLIQIPTSLLAMVDSSVGGKVGIDTSHGKNLLGAFYPPAEVRLSTDFLRTLPDAEFRNGMAEVWKYSLIGSPELYRNLLAAPLVQEDDCRDIVRACIAQKAAIVQADEFETTGLRATLNFGHTVGHAIESVSGYGLVPHGEAVAIGMVAELKLGEILGITERGLANDVREGLIAQGLPVEIPADNAHDRLIHAMRHDKKATRGKLAFSLVERAGVCKLYEDIPEAAVRQALTS